MVEFLQSLIANASDDFVVILVIAGLIALFVLGLKDLISKPVASGLMVSLGIFGTFWGILIALAPLDFSPEQMNDSVKALLDGMTTAFITSFLGLLFAIISKFIWELHNRKLGNKSVNPVHKDMNERLDAIKQAIAGEGDSSLVTQMQKLRDENRDGFKKMDGLAETIRETLVKNLQEMMEKLAADLKGLIADQLGRQLENLIKNIETALIEQFGKTFVEFNEGVQALKKWQEDHRQQVEQLTAAFDESAKGITQIKDDCNEIPPTMEKLKQSVEMANAQVRELDQRLEAFANMKKQAEEALPILQEHLERIGEVLRQSTDDLEKMQQEIIAAIETAVQENTAAITRETEAMKGNMQNAQEHLNATIKETIEKALEEFNHRINGEIEIMTQEWGQNLTSIAREYADVVTRIKNQ